MSTLLDQAIVEAEALREAAFHSAEAAVIEKYSGQIKEAVTHILEQEDFDLDVEEEDEAFGLPTPEEEDTAILDQVKTSVEQETGGMKPKVCLCPDEEEADIETTITAQEEADEQPGEETIVLDLAKLHEEIEALTEDDIVEGDGYGKSPAAFTDTENEEKEEIEDVEKEKALEEDLSLEEEIREAVKEIAESLKVDLGPTKSGWAGTPEKIMQHKAKQLLAMLQSDEHKEDFEAINNAVKKLQNENKNLQTTIEDSGKKLKNKQTHIEKLTEAVTMMKEILEESNVVNAKLLYKIRVLENNSLNERQKSHLAEKLSEAKSVEEAKLIFETLQSSVGSTKRHPESLSEAVERSSSAMLLARKSGTTPNDQAPALDRWKTLAGLK